MSCTLIKVANSSPPFLPPIFCPSSPSHPPTAGSHSSDLSAMKDSTATSSRQIRNQVYPKKRPTPHRDGVQKSRCRDLPSTYSRRTPAIIKAELQRQRQREAQLEAFRREGIYIEEEYRDEIEFYMHEMEVCLQQNFLSRDSVLIGDSVTR